MNLDDRRRFYAEEIEAIAHLDAPRLVAAYAKVPREAFLGPGPWQIVKGDLGYRSTPDADPSHLYHDVVVAIDPSRTLNNGQPSALARWIHALELGPGDRVMHVGTGLGYYTAIMAEVVGPTGRVTGVEIDPDLASRARANLASYSQVAIEVGDASAPTGMFDAIFVNAGCTFARPEWLAALADAGRIVLPLTVHFPQWPAGGVGVMLHAQRNGDGWSARVFSQVGIYDCTNARDPAHEPEIRKLLGGATKISALEVAAHERRENCVIHLDGFCLR
jgi:protein-L-isoaspartate(D-aspartate) O-methyltransferase